MIIAGNLHSVLRRLFEDLEHQGVSWTLLRAPSNPAAPSGDVDILVAPPDAGALRAAARRLGFVSLPGWESPPHLLLLDYDAPSGRWLVLDVATSVGFRNPAGWRPPDVSADVLRRRRIGDGVALPAEGDAFWLLALHCLLDRREVAAHYRTPLRELAGAGAGSALGSELLAAAGTTCAPAAFSDAALRGDWERLEALGERLIEELRRRSPVARRVRAAAARLAALARKPLLLRRRRGISVALLGPDGAGKSTVAAAVRKGFPLESRVIYMGLWKTTGSRPPGLGAALVRPLRIWRRYLLAQYHQLRGRLVIFDRYVYEARLPPKPPLVGLKKPYFWLLAHAVPPAGATIVLDAPGAVAFGRKHESRPAALDEDGLVYRGLASSVPGAELVDASRELHDVCADVTAIVWRRLASRWAGVAPRDTPPPAAASARPSATPDHG
jgi:thymidylate kinase